VWNYAGECMARVHYQRTHVPDAHLAAFHGLDQRCRHHREAAHHYNRGGGARGAPAHQYPTLTQVGDGGEDLPVAVGGRTGAEGQAYRRPLAHAAGDQANRHEQAQQHDRA